VEQDGKPFVELADTQEYLAVQKEGPLRLPSWGLIANDWITCENAPAIRMDFESYKWGIFPIATVFLARMESGGKTQLAGTGSYCWNGSCADGGQSERHPFLGNTTISINACISLCRNRQIN
jgi:hypothetical protein